MTRRSELFDTFGFVYLPGFLADDVGWISREFDAVWARRPDLQHDGVRRTIYPDSFLNASALLARLIEHPLLHPLCEELLGPGIAFYGGDGNYYAGDTRWHSDVSDTPEGWEAKTIARHLKVAFYLDALTPQTGALRVIPGSHLTGDVFARELQTKLSDPQEHLGIPPDEVPAVALSTNPGDIVAFDHRIKHASFGGGPARRMFTMNLFARCETDRQRELTAAIFRNYGREGKAHFFTSNVADGAPAERMERLLPALEFEEARAEGYAEYCARSSD